MTTTTRKTLETDKVVGEPVADPAVEQQGKAMDEAAAAGALPGATGEAQLPIRRGRQRTPKPWLMAVLCRIGIHEGQWAYAVEIDCTQGRECGRCGSVHVRTKHQREWRYVDDGHCVQLKVCKRCIASNGSRTKHPAWSEEWAVGADERAARCLPCGQVVTWRTDTGD